MYISVLFKNREMKFGGKVYDFKVDKAPEVGSIIRMMSEDGSKPVCNGTRVKVVAVKEKSDAAAQVITYKMSSMDEHSISKN